MKTSLGKLGLITAGWVLVSPLAMFAQNLSGQLGSARQDIGRLTLLSGPELLSWPRHVPAPKAPNGNPYFPVAPAATPAPVMRFVPSSGTLRLGPSQPPAFSAEGNPDIPGPKPKSPPSPETLRFDSTLTLPAVPLKKDAVPKQN